jgi:hypothetical protein
MKRAKKVSYTQPDKETSTSQSYDEKTIILKCSCAGQLCELPADKSSSEDGRILHS